MQWQRDRLGEIDAEIVKLGTKYDVDNPRYEKEYAKYQRGVVVEKTLYEGFRSGDIKAFVPLLSTGINVEWWAEEETRFSILYGTITLPKGKLSGTICPIRIEKNSFEAWIKSMGEYVDPEVTDGEFAKCYLLKEIEESRGIKKCRKHYYLEMIQKERPKLSRDAFDKIWAANAPENWKKSGRPNKK